MEIRRTEYIACFFYILLTSVDCPALHISRDTQQRQTAYVLVLEGSTWGFEKGVGLSLLERFEGLGEGRVVPDFLDSLALFFTSCRQASTALNCTHLGTLNRSRLHMSWRSRRGV